MPTKLLDAKQVAEILGCCWRSVLRLADRGELPKGIRVGSLRRWTPGMVEDFVRRQVEKSNEEPQAA